MEVDESSSSSDASDDTSTSSSSSSSSSSDDEGDAVDSDQPGGIVRDQDRLTLDELQLIEEKVQMIKEALASGFQREEEEVMRSMVIPLIHRVSDFLKLNLSGLDAATVTNFLEKCRRILVHEAVALIDDAPFGSRELPLELAVENMVSLLEKAFKRAKATVLEDHLQKVEQHHRECGTSFASAANFLLEKALSEDHEGGLQNTDFDISQFLSRTWKLMKPSSSELLSLGLPTDFPSVGLEEWLNKDYDSKLVDLKTWREHRFENAEQESLDSSEPPPVAVSRRRRL